MRPGTNVIVYLLVAAVALGGAGWLQGPIDREREDYELVSPGNVVAEQHPGYALLTIAPGGLRAPIVNYLWIRAENLKDAGRYYEAWQLSDMICRFMPRFPMVWGFHAWNMAWNISITAMSGEERWMWVHNGIRLLRDEAIPRNPRSLPLYKELGWIFFSKMGQTSDDMHLVYKQRWAAQMQRLLGAPPYGETASVIAAFRKIAEAPIDKDPRRPRRDEIQADVRNKLLAGDKQAARYAAMLGEHGVRIDRSLLEAYNRFSRDEAVEVVRLEAPKLKTARDVALSKLINAPGVDAAGARNRLLAFVRAQILWNVYKMDPDWMLHLMEKYNVPIDWRMVQSHGLYWVSYGMEHCKSDDILGNADALNIDRIAIDNLKEMTWAGRMTYTINPRDDDSPRLSWLADWRYIRGAHEQQVAYGKAQTAKSGEAFDQNRFREGHINFLIGAIKMLYAGYRYNEAQFYFDWIKKNYKPKDRDKRWELPLEDFVLRQLIRDRKPIQSVAKSLLQASIVAAFEQLAYGNVSAYRESLAFAERVHRYFHRLAPRRIWLGPLPKIISNMVAVMLIRPQTTGLYLNLESRHRIYVALSPEMQVMLYDRIAGPLRFQCAQATPKLDFDKAFPKPPGLDEYHRQQRQKLTAPKSK
ncbi:MAG: hypothetical protein J7M14_03215 [Planctomycetes bacterium]|nr:hypothetical protein [Planctomycetota bacterium]